jgi:glycosyltransferase involved in cell wall biosynthesis
MKSKKPLVSIVIPAYNCSQFINETLDSVYRQTYRNIEIIIIDDGSTDNTKAVLSPHIGNIKYFYQKNKGTATARNTGILKARGELIALLDNDDIWHPEKIELQVGVAQSNTEIGLVFTDGKVFDKSGILKHTLIAKRLQKWIQENETENGLVVKGSILNYLYLQNHISSATSVLIKRECFDQVGFFDEDIIIADDFDLWLRIARKYSVALIRKPLYKWRYRNDSSSGKIQDRNFNWARSKLVVLEKHWRNAPNAIRREVRENMSKLYWECGRQSFHRKNYLNSRDYFLASFQHNRKSLLPIFYLLATYLNPFILDRLRDFKRISIKNR